MISSSLTMPHYLRSGIKQNHKGSRIDKYIYGADTETYFGKPMSMQFYSEDTPCDSIHFVNEKNATTTFIKWCKGLKCNVQHVVYVHNLSFDLVEFLFGHHAQLVGDAGSFDFNIGRVNVKGVYGTPTFCTVTLGHDKRVMIVDSYSFYHGSLAEAAKLFCPDLPKLTYPQGLGSKLFTKRDTEFCAYAMRDAVIDYHIGRFVESMHQEYDIKQCVSAADMSSTIFRHSFLSYTIPQPEDDVIEASLLSYHGGKNNITVQQGWYTGVTSLDISSAYPDAMRSFPAFSNEKLYKRIAAKNGVKELPPYGVYALSGKVKPCQWPVIFSHGFKPLSGVIDRVWVQGFEVNEALRSGEFTSSKINGFYYDAERDLQAPALRGFVDHFYEKKNTTKDKAMRYLYKLMLNSISGKFIQTRKSNACAYTDIDADATIVASDLVAGGMFHPFIASAITAHTRARIHQLEHQYKAMHTATDGIMSQAKNAKPTGRGIGAITQEAQNATLLLIRNKCYVLYTKKSKDTFASKVFPKKHILKYAKHGFQGSVTDLERIGAKGEGTHKYWVNRPYRLKETINRDKARKKNPKLKPMRVNDFEKRPFFLKLGPMRVIENSARRDTSNRVPKRKPK